MLSGLLFGMMLGTAPEPVRDPASGPMRQPMQDRMLCEVDPAGVRAVRTVAREFIAADNAQDIERALALYADDAVLMAIGAAPANDATGVRKRYKEFFAAYDPAVEGQVVEACARDGVGYVRGRYCGLLRDREGGERRVNTAFVLMLREVEGGRWVITSAMLQSAA